MAAKDKQVVFMVGNSWDAKHGDRRTVDLETAERLVRDGHARYPAAKKAEESTGS